MADKQFSCFASLLEEVSALEKIRSAFTFNSPSKRNVNFTESMKNSSITIATKGES